MTWIHEASLVNCHLHSPEILQLLELDIDRNLIDYLVQITEDTVSYASGAPSTSQPRGRKRTRSASNSQLSRFVASVVDRSQVSIGVLLVAIVYIHRSKQYLSIEVEDWIWSRVFLGALILASKYTSDSTLKNKDWSLVTRTFGQRDIGRIEREFLEVLDWDLSVTEFDIIRHHKSIMSLYPRRSYRRPTRCPQPVICRAQPKEMWTEDDVDSDECSSSPSPLPRTPSSPANQPPSSPNEKESHLNFPRLFHYLLTDIPNLVLIP